MTALVLLVALLLCHGLLGVVHQLVDSPDGPKHSGELTSHAPAGDRGDHTGDYHNLGHPGYAAVLVSVLVWTIVGLLLNGVRARGIPAAPWLLRRYSPPHVFYSVRGATPPLTQVFRL